LSQYTELIEMFGDPFKIDQTVYHYTSAEGLKGIIENGEIWLTNTAFVNDTTECRAFWDLPKHEVLGTDPFKNKGYAEECWDDFQRCPLRENNEYIASFSESKDSLSQFHMYGGYCIGFDVSRLARRGFWLHRCVYTSQEIRAWIREKFSLEQWNGVSLDAQAKRAAAFYLFTAAPVKYKNAHYKTEREVRLFSVSTPDLREATTRQVTERQPPVHFRDHRTYALPVPYVKFFPTDHTDEDDRSDLAFDETPAATRMRRLEREKGRPRGLLPVTEVRIGPMMHQKEAKVACEILLQTTGYEDVKVEAVEIPYRGM